MKFRDLVDLLERYGGATPTLYYHGTSMKNFRSIMTHGLIPSPKKRAWSGDLGSFHDSSKNSVGGVYVTPNLMTAISSAGRGDMGADKLLVIMQLQPRSLWADEDDLSMAHLPWDSVRWVESNVTDLATVQLMPNPPERLRDWYNGVRDSYVKSQLSATDRRYKADRTLHPEERKRLAELFYEAFPTIVLRKAAYIDDYTWKVRTRSTSGMDDLELPQPNRAESETNFQYWQDLITRTTKRMASPADKADTHTITGRSPQRIGFRGVNRITHLLRIWYSYDEENYGSRAEILWPHGASPASLPHQTVEEWEVGMSKNPMGL